MQYRFMAEGRQEEIMSSEVNSGGVIAAAVALPVAMAFGAGWLAWKAGKLLVEANISANRQIAEKNGNLKIPLCTASILHWLHTVSL